MSARHASTPPPIILASASPRRRRLLGQLGLTCRAVPADIDETALPGETATDHVQRLALEKARVVAADHPDHVVVAGDTVVTLQGAILGKPADDREAVDMLLRLRGLEHRVESGIAVIAPGGREAADVVGADVRFRAFDGELAEAYVATGEPLDKAGAYGIQGMGSVLVESIAGDYFAVMGLPVARLVDLLAAVGWRYRFGDGLLPADDGPDSEGSDDG